MRRVLVLLLPLSLVAAACGDDGDTAGDPTTTSTPASTTPTTTAPTVEPAPTTTTAEPAPTNVGGDASQVNAEEMQRFLAVTPDDDGPFYMVNLIRYRDEAEYPDGRATDLSGREADEIYSEWMRTERLPALGAELVYAATVEDELIAGVSFDQVAVVRYPSRAEFAAMAADPEFREMSVHKQAGVADTVVMATSLLPTPRLPLVDAPFPATDDDRPFAFMHVLDFRETAEYQAGDADADDTRSGRDAVSLYSTNAGTVAMPLGIRSLAWFEVDAVLIGPVDTWDEVRINWFPSHATFDALTSDPVWQSGSHHRTAGLEETYAIRTAPVVNEFG